MCCGQKREALRNSGGVEAAVGDGAAEQVAAENVYYLRNVPPRLRVALTGRPNGVPAEGPRPAGSVPVVRR